MQELNKIPGLLELLSTEHMTKAEVQLIGISKSKEALDYLRSLMSDGHATHKLRQMAAAHSGRMLVDYSSSFPFGFPEEYFILTLGDFCIPFSIRQMLISSLRRYLKKSKIFVKRLVWLAKQLLQKLNQTHFGAQQSTVQSEIQPLINDFADKLSIGAVSEEILVNTCETFLMIGEVILSLIEDKLNDEKSEEEESQTKLKENHQAYLYQQVMEFLAGCKDFFEQILTEDHVFLYPDIFQKLFKMLEHPIELNPDNPLVTEYAKTVSQWNHLSEWFHLIYSINKTDDQLSYVSHQNFRERKYSNLKQTTSSFHSKLIEHLIESSSFELAKSMCTNIQPIKATVVMYNPTLPDKFIENLVEILYIDYLLSSNLSIAGMIADFQKIILPVISKILAADRFQLFAQSPAKMYGRLLETVDDQIGSHNTLASLSHIVYKFVEESNDFFLYLFQAFRFSLETQLGCESSQDWQPPDYLLKNGPIDICTVFYLMSIIPYKSQSEISSEVFSFLRQIITPSFVRQLRQMQIALFYFFLEGGGWLELYEDIDDGFFLLTYIFTPSLNSSSKYFLYQFVHTLSDYYINKDFILRYARNLPFLENFENKWSNMFKWATYLKEFQEGFTVELVRIIIGHIRDQIVFLGRKDIQFVQENYQEIYNYLHILVKIAKRTELMEEKTTLQRIMLEVCLNISKVLQTKIENVFYCLLSNLLPYFNAHEPIFLSLFPSLLRYQQINKLEASPQFYYVMAEYTTNSSCWEPLQKIIDYADQICKYRAMILDSSPATRQKILYNIANILIVLQNLILKRLPMIGQHVLRMIAVKCLAVKEFLRSNIRRFEESLEGWTVFARCLNLELAIFTVLKHPSVTYDIYLFYSQMMIFKEYDAKLLIVMLEQANSHTSSANRSIILKIMMNLLTMLSKENQEDQEDDDFILRFKRLHSVTNKMTAVVDIAQSVFKAIKKLMRFYDLPHWQNLHKFADNVDPSFVVKFKKLFQECARKDRMNQKLQAFLQAEYFLTNEDEKHGYLKRKRMTGLHEDEDDQEESAKKTNQDQDESLPRRRIIYESFTKRLKKDAELLPRHKQNELSKIKESRTKNEIDLSTQAALLNDSAGNNTQVSEVEQKGKRLSQEQDNQQ